MIFLQISIFSNELNLQKVKEFEKIEICQKKRKDSTNDLCNGLKMLGIFYNVGYKGLYGRLGIDAIKARKGIAPKEQLMDRMNTTELAANQLKKGQAKTALRETRFWPLITQLANDLEV